MKSHVIQKYIRLIFCLVMVSVRAQNKTIGNFSDYSDYQLSIMRFDAFNDGLDGDSVLN